MRVSISTLRRVAREVQRATTATVSRSPAQPRRTCTWRWTVAGDSFANAVAGRKVREKVSSVSILRPTTGIAQRHALPSLSCADLAGVVPGRSHCVPFATTTPARSAHTLCVAGKRSGRGRARAGLEGGAGGHGGGDLRVGGVELVDRAADGDAVFGQAVAVRGVAAATPAVAVAATGNAVGRSDAHAFCAFSQVCWSTPSGARGAEEAAATAAEAAAAGKPLPDGRGCPDGNAVGRPERLPDGRLVGLPRRVHLRQVDPVVAQARRVVGAAGGSAAAVGAAGSDDPQAAAKIATAANASAAPPIRIVITRAMERRRTSTPRGVEPQNSVITPSSGSGGLP